MRPAPHIPFEVVWPVQLSLEWSPRSPEGEGQVSGCFLRIIVGFSDKNPKWCLWRRDVDVGAGLEPLSSPAQQMPQTTCWVGSLTARGRGHCSWKPCRGDLGVYWRVGGRGKGVSSTQNPRGSPYRALRADWRALDWREVRDPLPILLGTGRTQAGPRSEPRPVPGAGSWLPGYRKGP